MQGKIISSMIVTEAIMLKKLLEGHKQHSAELDTTLEKIGYEYKCLGTGKSARNHSLSIKLMTITSRDYLNGEYLVVGCSNKAYGKGQRYYGYVKEVIRPEKSLRYKIEQEQFINGGCYIEN